MSDPIILEKPAQAGGRTLNQKIITWVQGKMGQKVGAGECWDLAEEALGQAGAHKSGHYGKVTGNADYKWGTKIKLSEVKPGEILQLRDHKVKIVTKVTVRFEDGSGWDEDNEATTEHPHHTAVVNGAVDANGVLKTIDQNVDPDGKVVQNQSLHTRSVAKQTTKEVKSVYDEDAGKKRNATVVTETTIAVSGTIWAYRPVAKPEEDAE